MALTDTQRAKVRRYLGYPDVGTELAHSLEGAMDNLTEAGEVEVEDILAKIATIDAQVDGNVAYAHLKRAEDVEFYAGGFGALSGRRNQLIDELANILGVDHMNTTGSRGGPCLRG